MKLVKKKYFNYIGKVYDLEVNSEDHSYTVNDVVVHNSAAGAVTSYVLGIVQTNPFDYDLLFERFLTKGRVKNSLPDIDIDFEGKRRNDVKHYLEQKYGQNQVCSVGTYATLKIKNIVKDIAKIYGASIEDVEYISKLIDPSWKFKDIIKASCESERLKGFINKNPEAINAINELIGQIRSTSIHACATLIVPKEKEIQEFIPIKKMSLKDGEEMLVSEWEGGELEQAGFLKEDILGIDQLNKFRDIIEFTKDHYGKKIDIDSIPYDDKKVFKYFCKGWNSDIFQFGTSGLSDYCKKVKPSNIKDLVAINALYRPGAMENNYHNIYVKRKNGEEEVESFTGADEILKETFGLFIYQEEIMKLCQVLGGINEEDSDKVRKALGKKKIEVLTKFKKQFIENYVNEYKVTEEYADDVWLTIEKSSSYLFNKSHSASYSEMGYKSQWLKVHHPLAFWVTAFKYLPTDKKKRDPKIAQYINELNESGIVSINAPNINFISDDLQVNIKENKIYWELSSIRMLGEKAMNQLKESKLEYFSFSEFLVENVKKGSKINKSHIENLVSCGAFDEIEDIKQPKERMRLINFYREEYKVKIDKRKDVFIENKDKLTFNWWWNLRQRVLCGYAIFDFESIVDYYCSEMKYYDFYKLMKLKKTKDISIVGVIKEIKIRSSKKEDFAIVTIDNNFNEITVKIWSKTWKLVSDIVLGKEGSILICTGNLAKDDFSGKNAVTLTENSEIKILN